MRRSYLFANPTQRRSRYAPRSASPVHDARSVRSASSTAPPTYFGDQFPLKLANKQCPSNETSRCLIFPTGMRLRRGLARSGPIVIIPARLDLWTSSKRIASGPFAPNFPWGFQEYGRTTGPGLSFAKSPTSHSLPARPNRCRPMAKECVPERPSANRRLAPEPESKIHSKLTQFPFRPQFRSRGIARTRARRCRLMFSSDASLGQVADIQAPQRLPTLTDKGMRGSNPAPTEKRRDGWLLLGHSALTLWKIGLNGCRGWTTTAIIRPASKRLAGIPQNGTRHWFTRIPNLRGLLASRIHDSTSRLRRDGKPARTSVQFREVPNLSGPSSEWLSPGFCSGKER